MYIVLNYFQVIVITRKIITIKMSINIILFYYQVCIWINVGNNFMGFIRLDPICSCKTEIP